MYNFKLKPNLVEIIESFSKLWFINKYVARIMLQINFKHVSFAGVIQNFILKKKISLQNFYVKLSILSNATFYVKHEKCFID